jgi:acyl carrier protein
MDKQEIWGELRKILSIVDGELLEHIEVTDDTSIREGLGLDSLQLTEVLFEIEERLGAKIGDEEARGLQTVGDLVKVIEAKTAANGE